WCSASRPAQSHKPARQSNITAHNGPPACPLSYVAQDERARQPEPVRTAGRARITVLRGGGGRNLSGNRLDGDVRQRTLDAVRGDGHDGEVPRARVQIIYNISLHADGNDPDGLNELPGVRTVVDAVADEIRQRCAVCVGGGCVPGNRCCSAGAAQAMWRSSRRRSRIDTSGEERRRDGDQCSKTNQRLSQGKPPAWPVHYAPALRPIREETDRGASKPAAAVVPKVEQGLCQRQNHLSFQQLKRSQLIERIDVGAHHADALTSAGRGKLISY